MRCHSGSLDRELRGEEGHPLGHSHAGERLSQSWQEGGGREQSWLKWQTLLLTMFQQIFLNKCFFIHRAPPRAISRDPKWLFLIFTCFVCLTQERDHRTQHAALPEAGLLMAPL